MLFKKCIWNHEITNTSSSAITQKNGVKPALESFHCCLHVHWWVILCRKLVVLLSEDSGGGCGGGHSREMTKAKKDNIHRVVTTSPWFVLKKPCLKKKQTKTQNTLTFKKTKKKITWKLPSVWTSGKLSSTISFSLIKMNVCYQHYYLLPHDQKQITHFVCFLLQMN